MVSGALAGPGPARGSAALTSLAGLPRTAIGAGVVALLAIALAAAVGGLPLPGAALLVLGLPLLAWSTLVPRAALGMLIFSIPFSSWTSVSVGSFDVTATDPLVAILVGGWLVRGALAHRIVVRAGPTIAWMTLLFGAELLSTLTALNISLAAKELIKLAEMIAVATYVASAFDRPEVLFCLTALLTAGSIEALNGLRQFVTRSGPEFFAIGGFLRAYGDFGQPNALAGYLGMLLPFGVVLTLQPGELRTRVVMGTLTSIILAGVLATLSRGAWLGTLCGFLVMALVGSQSTRRAFSAALGVGAGLFGLGAAGVLPSAIVEHLTVLFDNFGVFDVRTVQVTPENFSVVERMAHWQAGWAMAMDHPLVGVGPGNYAAAYADYSLPGWLESLGHAHNYYINTYAELGIVGLLVFAGFLVAIFVQLAHGLRLAPNFPMFDRLVLLGSLGAVIGFCVHNTFDNMFVHGIGLQFALILGLVEVTVRKLEVR